MADKKSGCRLERLCRPLRQVRSGVVFQHSFFDLKWKSIGGGNGGNEN
jgi:hypothetical protein